MFRSLNGHRAVVAVSMALTACTAGLASAPAALAGASWAAAGQWRVVATTPGFLDAVIAPASASAWAFGWVPKSGGLIAPVVRHWNGHRWAGAALPSAVKDTGMACAGASSLGNVWAFSGAGASLGNPPATAGALRLRRGRWVLRKSFPGSYVTGCNVLGPQNVWVFGGEVAGLGAGVGTWHLTRSGWASVHTGNLVLFRASVVSAHDIWAAGANMHGTQPPTPAVAVWNGTAWVQNRSIGAALPKPTGTTGVGIDAIKALSPRNVWVEAFTEGQARVTRVIVVHWDGSRWRRVLPTSFGYHLPGAVSDGHGGWWAQPFAESPSAPYLLHGADGRWSRFQLPIRVAITRDNFGLARVPHTASMLAAGTSNHGGVILAR